MAPEQIAGVAVVLLAGSELLSFVPQVKANGWVQLLLAILKGMASVKTKQR